MSARRVVPVVVAAAIVAFALGWWAGSGDDGAASPVQPSADAATEWTCSMHPQVRLPEPGPCPICFMDLIPVQDGAAAVATGPSELAFSETAKRLARVRTVPVTRGHPEVRVRMSGTIGFDETRIRTISPYVGGRLDRLYVDYTWLPVQKGDHLADLYSPALIAAQGEYLEALDAREALASSELEIMRETAARTVDAAREKLRLLGMTAAQVEALEDADEVSDTVTLYSPMSGVVVEKAVQEGMYVDTGTVLYRIADLDVVWIELDAYESDLAWIHLGQEVGFTVEAYPGETFRGRISFIDPVVDPRTRTVGLRVRVANDDGRLKPDMLVRAVVDARIAAGGKVYDPYLSGKWISPMHPWVVKERPGACDVCGMSLVPAEDLGYEPARGDAPLLIPDTAPLLTGKRAVVYVERVTPEGPVYEGRDVELGPHAGDVYVVHSGLAEGERVVTEGAFRIDASLQIRAGRSMMNPDPAPAPEAGHDHAGHDRGPAESGGPLSPALVRAYLDVAVALADDDPAAAREALDRVAVAAVAHPAVHAASLAGRNALGVDGTRDAFHDLSDAVVAALRAHGSPVDGLVVAHCPMTSRGGGDWVQADGPIANPYFGAAMLRCGAVVERLALAGAPR